MYTDSRLQDLLLIKSRRVTANSLVELIPIEFDLFIPCRNKEGLAENNTEKYGAESILERCGWWMSTLAMSGRNLARMVLS
jgi:hypothetical protein